MNIKQAGAPIERVDVSAYTIPTDAPEGDGTLRWDSTTLVVCQAHAGGEVGLGYTYGNVATALVASQLAAKCLRQRTAFDIPACHACLVSMIRNDSSRGIGSMAISCLDIALWDLKSRLLGVSAVDLLGSHRKSVDAYGSGGFTTYSQDQMVSQLAGWVEKGLRRVKIKIGAEPENDLERVRIARDAIGRGTELFVDANGAYGACTAAAHADEFKEFQVRWFEEPVSSDDLEGLRYVRDHAPRGMEIAAGEYGYDSLYFRRMLEAGAVDVLQLDATRCKGFSGFLNGAAVAGSFGYPLSAHCAPSLHLHVGCAVANFRHVEYFHDHARIEEMLFDGFIAPDANGKLEPDRARPGLGLTFKHSDAERFAVWSNR